MAQKDREISELKRQLVSFHNKVGHLQAENLALITLIDGQRAEFVEDLKSVKTYQIPKSLIEKWEGLK